MTARSSWLLMLGFVAALSLWPCAHAQVSEPTEADKARVPVPFRPSASRDAGPPNFTPHGTPKGYVPPRDGRDFTGSYVMADSGPPGGAGALPPPGGGTPSPGTAPPAGAPPGNAPAGIDCIPSFDYGAYAIHIVSSANRLTVIGEENHRVRRIYVGARLPEHPVPEYLGHSVGHWQGKVLVIDTVGVRNRPGLQQRERWERRTDGSIDIATTRLAADGSEGAAEHSVLIWRPDLSFVENVCEDFGEAFGPGYSGRKQ